MKKHLPLVVLLLMLFVSVCSAQNGKGSKAARGTTGALEAMLMAKEKELWEGWKNKNPAPFEKLIPADGLLVGEQGVETKAELLKDIASNPCEVKSYSFDNIRLTMINKDAALVTYKAAQAYTCMGHAGPTPVFASSVYVKRKGQWLNILHQETAATPN